KSTLLEVLTNPEVVELLRNRYAAMVKERKSMVEHAWRQKLRTKLADAFKGALNKVKTVARFVTSPVQTIVRGAISTYRQVNTLWNLRKPILVALGVGVVVGAVAYASAPWIAGVIAGCGAASTTLLGQFAAWARRLYGSFVVG